MNIIKTFKEFNESITYDYDCIMYELVLDNWDSYLNIIDKEDICENGVKGLETEPHVTLVYGLHPGEYNEKKLVNEILSFGSIDITISSIGIFENSEEFDVLKLEVEQNQKLNEIREKIINFYPNTQSFDEYIPHATIAYLKKGTGIKYTKKLEDKIQCTLNTIIFSKSNGNKMNYIIH